MKGHFRQSGGGSSGGGGGGEEKGGEEGVKGVGGRDGGGEEEDENNFMNYENPRNSMVIQMQIQIYFIFTLLLTDRMKI